MMYNEDSRTCVAKIKIIGVGGGGSNAVNRMIDAGISDVEFYAVNTDKQALSQSKVPDANKIQIGKNLTKGLGAGSLPEIGREAANESRDELEAIVQGADLVFVTAGMGGGTGTGAAPLIAKMAKDLGILTIAVVTKPFNYERRVRMERAIEGIEELKKVVDTLVIVPNQKLMEVLDSTVTLSQALECADEMLRQGICAIVDIIATCSEINLDFADVKTVLLDKGMAHMGIGLGKGENRVAQAVSEAVQSPLLETSIEGAKNVILNIVSSRQISLGEISEITESIGKVIDENASFIYGQTYDDKMDDQIKIIIIASDFTGTPPKAIEEEIVNDEFENLQEYGNPNFANNMYERHAPNYNNPQNTYQNPAQNFVEPNNYGYQQQTNQVEDVTPKEVEQKNSIPEFMRRFFKKK